MKTLTEVNKSQKPIENVTNLTNPDFLTDFKKRRK